MAKWLIEFDDGGFDVTRNGRAFQYGCDDVDEALRAIWKSRHYDTNDTIKAYDRTGNRVLVRK